MTADAAASAFPLLFSPITVGPLTLRNRVVNLPQGMGYTNVGHVEPEDIAYHRRRALGGVGLVVTGGTAADPSSLDRTCNFVALYDPTVVPGLRRRAEAVHEAGAHIVGQVFNLGRYMNGEGMVVPPLAPSAVRAPGIPFAPMAMGRAEIADVIEGFRLSAVHLRESGCDGIEIHGAHGYLLAQFLSAATNQRDDEYGGDARRRLRLLVEVARAVREACGPDFVVGVRLSADDEVPGGTTVEESRENVTRLIAAVPIDYVSLAIGTRGTYEKDSGEPEGIALSRIAEVRADLGIPVIASQRLRRPEHAEQVLRAGQADLIGMARALIADPDWAIKAQRGDAARIRLCVGDLQDCRSHLAGGLRCMVNPDVGQEARSVLPAPGTARGGGHTVVIVGAGPAGLEAARLAASHGFAVTLHEARASAGGQLAAAAGFPGRSELLDFLTYQLGELTALGVELRLGSTVTPESADVASADAVIVATGSVGAPLSARFEPAGPGTGDVPVCTDSDVLTGAAPSASRAVVLDDKLGSWSMLTAAASLAARGTTTTVTTPGGSVLAGVPAESQAGVARRLRSLGVTWLVDLTFRSVSADCVDLVRTGTGERVELPADLLVVTTGRQPVDGLWRELRDRRHLVVAAGDAQTPRTIGNATRAARAAVERVSDALLLPIAS